MASRDKRQLLSRAVDGLADNCRPLGSLALTLSLGLMSDGPEGTLERLEYFRILWCFLQYPFPFLYPGAVQYSGVVFEECRGQKLWAST